MILFWHNIKFLFECLKCNFAFYFSSKFCDGINDCGDNSDEPNNCEHDCSLALEAFNETLICDGKVNCINEHDMGNDESVEKCCTGDKDNNYR